MKKNKDKIALLVKQSQSDFVKTTTSSLENSGYLVKVFEKAESLYLFILSKEPKVTFVSNKLQNQNYKNIIKKIEKQYKFKAVMLNEKLEDGYEEKHKNSAPSSVLSRFGKVHKEKKAKKSRSLFDLNKNNKDDNKRKKSSLNSSGHKNENKLSDSGYIKIGGLGDEEALNEGESNSNNSFLKRSSSMEDKEENKSIKTFKGIGEEEHFLKNQRKQLKDNASTDNVAKLNKNKKTTSSKSASRDKKSKKSNNLFIDKDNNTLNKTNNDQGIIDKTNLKSKSENINNKSKNNLLSDKDSLKKSRNDQDVIDNANLKNKTENTNNKNNLLLNKDKDSLKSNLKKDFDIKNKKFEDNKKESLKKSNDIKGNNSYDDSEKSKYNTNLKLIENESTKSLSENNENYKKLKAEFTKNKDFLSNYEDIKIRGDYTFCSLKIDSLSGYIFFNTNKKEYVKRFLIDSNVTDVGRLISVSKDKIAKLNLKQVGVIESADEKFGVYFLETRIVEIECVHLENKIEIGTNYFEQDEKLPFPVYLYLKNNKKDIKFISESCHLTSKNLDLLNQNNLNIRMDKQYEEKIIEYLILKNLNKAS